MAHRMHTGCRLVSLDDWKVNHSSKKDGLLIPPEVDGGSLKLVKGYREGTKIELINLVDESLTTSSKNVRRESEGTPFLPSLTSLQNSETVLEDTGLNPGTNVSLSGTDSYLPKMPVLASYRTESQLRKPPFPEGIAWNWEEEVKSSALAAGKNNLDVSEHRQDDILGSTFEFVYREFNSGRTSIQPSRRNHIYRSDATFFNLEKRMDKEESQSIHDPSTSKNWKRSISGKQPQKVKNHSGTKLFRRSYGLRGTHSSVHDVERVRIYTTVDSVQEFSSGPPKFSQTTNHLLITEKTDVNLSDGDQILGKLSLPTNFKGKAVYELLTLSPHFGSNVKQGVKLQPLDCTASATNTNHESSDDTDTLEMQTTEENHLSGLSLYPSNKDVKESQKMFAPEASIPWLKEEGRDKMNSVLPNINQDISVFPDMAKSEDDNETSASRIQSLDAAHFLSQAEHPRDLKFRTLLDVNFGMDPSSRWVRRLKPNASDSFGHGRENSRMAEAFSRGKMIKSCGKERILMNWSELSRNARSPSSYTVRQSLEIRILRAWIRRWCHVQSAIPKWNSGDAVGTETKSSKTTLDFQKMQFPSVAAVALMGKTIPCFHRCKFKKKGSIVEWDARG